MAKKIKIMVSILGIAALAVLAFHFRSVMADDNEDNAAGAHGNAVSQEMKGHGAADNVSRASDNSSSSEDNGSENDNTPFVLGQFEAKGLVTAVNASTSQIALNGLLMNAGDARFSGSGVSGLADVSVGDRADVKGQIQNGSISPSKAEIQRPRPLSPVQGGGVGPDVIRSIQAQIQSILDKINQLFQKINGTASSTSQ